MADKKFIKRRHNLSLLNVDPNLDLMKKYKEINGAITMIANGGVNGDAYNDVETIVIRKIAKRSIQLDCKESDKFWHRKLGRELAKNYGMMEFCFEDFKSRKDLMFEWY
ncbi:hypothetical protein [Clostridium akagii]|uniref:hypothetical protein n=1 Tax=Clostridium akagii TaxID=91623 RepID=UPI00047B29CC|nr:hypothetical protein [Clostridium akagii]